MFGLGQKPKPSPVASAENPIRTLVSQLMNEPFASSQHLEEATLDQLGRTLEEAASDYERSDLPPSLKEAADSFTRCKDLYCQILLDLESLTGVDWEQKTLAELAEGTLAAAAVAPTPADMPAGIPFEAPTPETPVDEPSFTSDFPPMEMPGVPEAPMFVDTPTPVAPIPDAPAEDLVESMEPTLITDLGKLQAEAAAPSTATSEEPTTKAPEPLPSFAIPKSVKLDLGLGQKGKELQLISEWLRSLAPKEPSSVDSPQISRIATQLLGAAMELECWERMREGTRKVWEKRESAIKRIFDAKKSPWCLPQGTKDQLAQLEKSLVKKAPSSPLPYFAMENSLRYLMTLPKFESFRLSLLDAGTFLFFFGQKRELREYQLENHYWTQEGKIAETAEAALRLIRLHELHKRSLTPWSEVEEWLSPEKTEEEAEKILVLFDAVGLRRGR